MLVSGFQAEQNKRKKAAMLKSTLIELPSARLASRMVHKFMSIVLACPTCLDKTDNSFGDKDELVAGFCFSLHGPLIPGGFY